MHLMAEDTCSMSTQRNPYSSDVGDAEWAFVVPYLTRMRLDASQRDDEWRAVFNALRGMACAGVGWRLLSHDLPPWPTVSQQTQRWLRAGVFAHVVHHLRVLLRRAAGRNAEPSAAIFDSRTRQSSVESGGRAGDDGYKRKRGSKVHRAVDTLGCLLSLYVTPANVQHRAVATLAAQVQAATGAHVTLA